MRRSLMATAILAGAMVLAPQAGAQAQPDRNCTDDRGVDRCAPEQHRRVLALYGMKPIEEHARAGDQVRRAFYVDGYGRDTVAIAFVRSAGQDPTLFVHFPRQDGAAPRPPATALIPQETWEAALRGSRLFDRELVPLAPPPDRGEISICLHSWVYTIEAVDLPERAGGQPEIRREVEDACENGLAEVFASQLSELAIPLLPYCSALDPKRHRNAAARLRACGSLEGDRLAAASAHNVATDLFGLNRPEDLAEARGLFDYQARLDWAEPSSGSGRAAEQWIERTTGASRASFYFSRVIGETGDTARIEGELVRSEGGEDGEGPERRYRAPVTLFVGKIDDGYPRIERGTIGRFVPVAN